MSKEEKPLAEKKPLITKPIEEKETAAPLFDQIPEDTKIEFSISSMFSITLKNGTRVSFAEGISYRNGLLNLETFRLTLLAIQKQSEQISNPQPPQPAPPKSE